MSKIEDLNKVAQSLKGLGGCFLVGKIEGVDFTARGSMIDKETKKLVEWGNSVKLRFIQKINTTKSVGETLVPTTKLNAQIIKIDCEDSELIPLIQKYNKMIDKEVLINLELPNDTTYKTNDVFEIA